jgi:NADH:ubiquinone oxidoreductase subunit 5 (subunit L)/multisubunit Na+/H+ antiporter MnhA subunit
MEGPTPVSALIHAATMVTAGVFLIIRLAFIFENSLVIRFFLIIIGSFTALFSAITAFFLFDIKKIIAYSTCSQLGYMILACGLSQYNLGLFHLINHAFFKALLFLSAGAIIHYFNNEQDIRYLILLFRNPFLYIVFFIGNFALIGVPFLTSYYSKDLIIEYLFFFPIYSLISLSNFIYYVIIIAIISTALYSYRLFYYLFFRFYNQHYEKKYSFVALSI